MKKRGELPNVYVSTETGEHHDDDYAGRGEAPVIWVGRGAAELKLSGVFEDGERRVGSALMVTLVGFVAIGLGAAILAGLLVGSSWQRLLMLAVAGLALWSLWSVYALGRQCPESGECLPEIGIVLGLFVLCGWLGGLGSFPFMRRLLRRRGGRPSSPTRDETWQ